MKIISSGKGIHSQEFYKKKRKRRRLKIILSVVLLVIFCGSLVYLSREERLLIQEVVIAGENITGRDYLKDVVEEKLQGYYFWLVPKSNSLLYPRKLVKSTLLTDFPRIKSLKLDLEGLKTLTIYIEERVTNAIYCPDISVSTRTNSCYLLDEDGYIFASAGQTSEFGYFIYTTREGIPEPVGKELVTPEEFRKITTFRESLSELNIYPYALEISSGQYVLELAGGGEIIWKRSADLSLIYTNLGAFLSSEAIVAEENFLDRILYLDLSTEDKVFYRLGSEE